MREIFFVVETKTFRDVNTKTVCSTIEPMKFQIEEDEDQNLCLILGCLQTLSPVSIVHPGDTFDLGNRESRR